MGTRHLYRVTEMLTKRHTQNSRLRRDVEFRAEKRQFCRSGMISPDPDPDPGPTL
jgi:hypothetical protein